MFSVPTRTQYGIRALVHLAMTEARSVTSSEIAKAQAISPKYLEGILGQLKNSGLILSERGAHGGYRLARLPENIRMIDIVEALEGEVRPVDCVEDSGCCDLGVNCLPRRFWMGLKEAIDGYFASKTLKDVIEI
ncbi:MAG TPA: Rrf2 family transcriptional regulator [Rectinemataceae bacterium]|nr:Rrf2 family transcriptional regulator [Rectinemataceae bacterium]